MQNLSHGFVEIIFIEEAVTSQKLYDVMTIFFLRNANLNKSMLHILLLNALFPLALVLTRKDVSCVSL